MKRGLLMPPPSDEFLKVGGWWVRNRNVDVKCSMCLRLIRRISLAQCSVTFEVVSG